MGLVNTQIDRSTIPKFSPSITAAAWYTEERSNPLLSIGRY
ncbi:hypothetical protein [Microcoleus sp.]